METLIGTVRGSCGLTLSLQVQAIESVCNVNQLEGWAWTGQSGDVGSMGQVHKVPGVAKSAVRSVDFAACMGHGGKPAGSGVRSTGGATTDVVVLAAVSAAARCRTGGATTAVVVLASSLAAACGRTKSNET